MSAGRQSARAPSGIPKAAELVVDTTENGADVRRCWTIGIQPVTDPRSTGIYHYSATLLDVLARRRCVDPQVVVCCDDTAARASFSSSGWRVHRFGATTEASIRVRSTLRRALPHSVLDRVRDRQAARSASRIDIDADIPIRPELRDSLREADIDAMIYPAPSHTAIEAGLPFAAAIHDLQHQLQPQFPEVSANGVWEQREFLFRNLARHAAVVITDSEIGKEDVLTFYGDLIDDTRVLPLPYLPPPQIARPLEHATLEETRRRYHLPARFLFYPAHFWPHKNHISIVRAIAAIRSAGGRNVHVVFAGSARGSIPRRTLRDLMREVAGLRVSDLVHFMGHVDDADMAAIYRQAEALCMPTFFGPTNIPVLEAWSIGCPVITSDIRGLREQSGDAALLVDPTSVEALAHAIERLWESPAERDTLAKKGRERLSSYTLQDFERRVETILVRLGELV